LFGLGLFQARLVPLALILLTLALTHRLGAKLFSPWHGTMAIAILVTWRIAGPFAHLVSGIPLADVARIIRYDSAVPVFRRRYYSTTTLPLQVIHTRTNLQTITTIHNSQFAITIFSWPVFLLVSPLSAMSTAPFGCLLCWRQQCGFRAGRHSSRQF
jgi:hypothetical protein